MNTALNYPQQDSDAVRVPTSFPGFSPTRPYGARERERDSGRNVTRPNQGLSTGRREKLGTRLCEYQNGSSRPCTRELMFVLANCVHTFSVSSKEIYCFVGRNGKIKRICYSYMSGIQSENTTSFRAVTQTLVLGHHL